MRNPALVTLGLWRREIRDMFYHGIFRISVEPFLQSVINVFLAFFDCCFVKRIGKIYMLRESAPPLPVTACQACSLRARCWCYRGNESF